MLILSFTDSAWIIFEHISKSVSSHDKEGTFEIQAGLYFRQWFLFSTQYHNQKGNELRY